MRNSIMLKNKFIILSVLFLCAFSGNAQASNVMIDQGHGQAFLVEKNGALDLSGLGKILESQGSEVKVNSQTFHDSSFDGIDALVISGPFRPMSDEEIDAVLNFINRGGRLSVMLHIPSPVASLLRKLGVVYSYTPINEQENILDGNSKDFSIVSLQPHPITEGVDSFKAFGIWGVMNEMDNSAVIASASPKAWVDMNKNNTFDDGDGVYPYGLVVAGKLGKGEFVVFGDDAIFQNQFLNNENVTLATNLAKWLK